MAHHFWRIIVVSGRIRQEIRLGGEGLKFISVRTFPSQLNASIRLKIAERDAGNFAIHNVGD